MLRNLVTLVYLAAGAVIASNHHYFSHLHGVKHIVSAVLAVTLWPLIVLGVSLHLH